MNQIDLADRVAVITGGSGGIGLVTAERMRLSGAMVVLWDLDAAALRSAQAALPEAGIARLDVTDEAAVARCTAEVTAKHGRIDILVNAAGVTSRRTSVGDFPVDLWRRIVEINLTGTFLCCRAVVPHMQASGYGRIVNLASVAGKEGNPYSAAYSAAKAGVISLTKSLGKELAATEIRVNCVAPAMIAWLASEECSFSTGAAFDLSGGRATY
jgi:NAD(P)-dependent dehydrogenase (short-subunit alcohol dehydrogenase family)